MKLSDVTTLDGWRTYEGQRWLEAVVERGLRRDALPDDERWLVERAETRNREQLAKGLR